eukprot:c6140_g1_i2.p1 GENE.c6140_g1_i2~~c6140_g1_i2.p1  ORF type:complete len:246 (+),score=52.39 c6140_g1_i2:495-1232(+)
MDGVRLQPQFEEFVNRADEIQSKTSSTIHKNHKELLPLFRSALTVEPIHRMLLKQLAERTGGKMLLVDLKGMGTCLEKARLPAGTDWSVSRVCDVVRGGVEFDNMTQTLFFLELLVATDPSFAAQSKERGWDAEAVGITQKIKILLVKNRFGKPSTGGWAVCMINFSIRCNPSDDDAHVCEVQLVHANMMLARTNMGAHRQYERYRSAVELLAATGHLAKAEEIELMERFVVSFLRSVGTRCSVN